ncbi:MAG: F0F1 ATP synthase subunit delta [Chthoniobacteraceae bacterium]|nr:F0F1 ATP synthase subunit delta [Chthoniobacteraceae bacterium]
MKVSKDARHLSRSLFRSSFSHGRLDPARVKAVLATVAARRPRHSLEALKDYEQLVRMELARRHAVIESATPLDPATADEILRDLRTRFGADITHETKVNPALLGGIRVQLGSDVWDGSVSGRLELLRSRL